jgi:deoxyribose-phosphate aldolase
MKERTLFRVLGSGTGCVLPDDAVATEPALVSAICGEGAVRISAGPGIASYEGFDAKLASMIDHTLLRPEASDEDVDRLCAEAREYGFASVCVAPSHVSRCARALQGTPVHVCTVVGFPFGTVTTETKIRETEEAAANGACEFDLVLHVGKLKSRDYRYVDNDIRSVVRTARKADRFGLVKVIIETCLLEDEEKIVACLLAREAGADFVKTSTGFGTGGATVGDVSLMRMVVGTTVGVKASGGISSAAEARALAASGAERIGASASVKIIQDVS